MKIECFEFRSRLRDALAAPPSGELHVSGSLPDVQALGWHAHLLSCSACRQLLESEQALDELLASLPKPRLTEARRTILLQRLGVELRLENLLELADPYQAAPLGLADRIRARVAEETLQGAEERDLERWLARIDRIEAPQGLSQRAFARCLAEGDKSRDSNTIRPKAPAASAPSLLPGRKVLLRHWIPTSLVAAGLAALLWYLPGIGSREQTQNPGIQDPDTRVAMDPKEDEANPEMLAVLDSLEVLHMVDELNAEEWDLLDEYDRLGLFLLDDATDGSAGSNVSERAR